MTEEEDNIQPRQQKVLERPMQIPIDHALYRNAPKISIIAGVVCAASIYIFGDTPEWMPPFLGVVIAVVINRILRPKTRGFNIEDEI